MQKSLFKKSLATFLAMLLLASVFTALPVSAASTPKTTANGSALGAVAPSADSATVDKVAIEGTEIQFHQDMAGGEAGRPYLEYRDRYKAVAADGSFIIPAVDFDTANTTAEVKKLSADEVKALTGADMGEALYMPASGVTSWKFSLKDYGVTEDSYYAVRITYFPLTEFEGKEVSTYTTIERTLYIDGRIPFSEARYFYFPRTWEYTDYTIGEDGYYIFKQDASGNDVRPVRQEKPTWQTYFLRDWLGYTMDPFQFYFTADKDHVFSFEGSREPMLITNIEFYGYQEEPTYDEFLAQKEAEGVKIIDKIQGGVIKIQAENPYLVSNACLFPSNDRTSALTEPQNPREIRNNIVISNTVNQWMQYIVDVPEEGLYTIAIRFRQNDLIGMFTSRRILINNEIQFREASNIRFKFSPNWQGKVANNGEQEFTFYLKKGENTITFETVLGDMTEYVYQIEQLIDSLNAAYKNILQLTGPTPDAYRDYGFNRLVPQSVEAIRKGAEELYRIADELEAVTGEIGDQVASLRTFAMLFEKMGKDEYEIAPNFVTFKNYIIALSNWLYASLNQPLKMDYFTVQGTEDPVPKGQANFFESALFEIKAFIGSFYMDYTTVDFKAEDGKEYTREETVEQWITSALGREDALITRNLVDTYFTPQSGITVKMKVITTGLTEAVLAGMGPDVATMTTTDTITWGLRNAVEPLDDMPGFDEVMSWFGDDQAALVPLQMTDVKGVFRTYGLPQTLGFYMMFYRTDLLAGAGVKEVPTTWQGLYDILPTLQSVDLEVGMPATLGAAGGAVDSLEGLKLFLYQMGGELYADGGYSVALGENVALDAFEAYCNMFTEYRCSVQYDLTRFRTGEIPIIIGDAVTTYNTLMTYYDIRGLWKMAPLLGIEQEDGSINHTSTVVVSSMVIPRGAYNPEASWEYIKWSVSPETQKLRAKENLMVNPNPTTKFNTPTIEALLGQAWTAEEKAAIEKQAEQLVGVREYPGNYIIKTYVSSAFMKVYGSFSNASDELLDRIPYINKEIARKRKDFKMDWFDMSGEYHEGRYITSPIYGK
jgi:ABC-type glycerol-3-phosphate transport system substrate-binding protein